MELVEFKNGHVNTVHEHIAITKVKEFLNNHDISKDKGGIHKISTDFFYNIIDMETTTEENRPWESHKEYYDVHYLLNGEETILYNFLSQMELSEYKVDDDWQQMNGEALFSIILKKNMLLLLEPNDSHKTGLLVEEPINIKKVVFKVKI